MISDDIVADHYDRADLVAAIAEAVTAAGLSRDGLTEADLAAVGEFHAGGRPATEHLLDQLNLGAGKAVLDIGCGIGGAARFCAEHYGTEVTGVDLTPSYIEAAQELTAWVGLSSSVTFRVASGADLPFKKRTFDAACLLHVGMNVADKTGLFSSVAHVLKPGARFGIYDMMRTALGDLTLPVPWASSSATSFVSTPESYEASLVAAGFQVVTRENRQEIVLESMRAIVRHRTDGPDGMEGTVRPQPLGLHLLMGQDAGARVANMVAAMEAGIIAPVEIVAERGA